MHKLEPSSPTHSTTAALGQEWSVLQTQHGHYELAALLIKFAAIGVYALAWQAAWPTAQAILLICVLWLQEGIFRTTQARIGTRLLAVEDLSKQGGSGSAFQLHTQWSAHRGGALRLLGEYVKHALRPTVAFPYAVFAAAIGAFSVFAPRLPIG